MLRPTCLADEFIIIKMPNKPTSTKTFKLTKIKHKHTKKGKEINNSDLRDSKTNLVSGKIDAVVPLSI